MTTIKARIRDLKRAHKPSARLQRLHVLRVCKLLAPSMRRTRSRKKRVTIALSCV